MTTSVTIDIAGGQVGGAARYAREVYGYLERSAHEDVKLIGKARRLGPAWLAIREAKAVRRGRRVALNNVGFFTPGGERWTLVANPLHFLTRAEWHAQVPEIRSLIRPQIPVVHQAARRSDVLVAPSTAMAERIAATLPDVAGRVVVRLHPVSANPVPRRPGGSRILCPVLFSPYKNMPERLSEWLAAVSHALDPAARLLVTADPGELPRSIADNPRIEMVGRLALGPLCDLWASSQAVFFPSGLESFGFPLAEARVNGQPVIAQDTPINREIAGPALCGYTTDDPDSLLRATQAALTMDLAPDPAPFDPDAYFDWLLGKKGVNAGRGGQRIPRLGVFDLNPIQYHTPLYRRLAHRGNVRLDVLYLSDHGLKPVLDPGFGVPVAWDIDLLSGYEHEFLAGPPLARWRRLSHWLRCHDAVVTYGHSNPWMLAAAAGSRARGVPYLLRGDSGPRGQSGGVRGAVRYVVARAVVAGSAGGLAAGQRNEQFYARYGARRIIFAPHSVDNERFAASPAGGRAGLLTRWGLDGRYPVIMFCGKLQQAKRPLDLAAAVARLDTPVNVLFVGDGALAGEVRSMLPPGRGAVTGFVNQAELPSYYHAADILVLPSQSEPWGLVVNEAMTAGVLPVVSDQVGCGPDLVAGLGEVYPCADVAALTAALRRGLSRIADPRLAGLLRERVDRYGIDATAAGFERAAVAATAGRPAGRGQHARELASR